MSFIALCYHRLSDDLAFRVRAQQAALWRAQVFDRYDGTTWTITDDRTQPLAPSKDGLSVDVPVDVPGSSTGSRSPNMNW